MQSVHISVKELSEDDFFSMRTAWEQLLNKSSADKLFMSWEWLTAWWETWGRSLKLKLLLLGVYRDETLIALAPLYIYKRKLPCRANIKEIHFIGNASRIASTVRTEYVDLIINPNYVHTTAQALENYLLERCEWDLIAINDQVKKSTLNNFSILAARLNLSVFVRSYDMGVCINTSGKFPDWLKRLGPNTRLKAYNRREFLLRKYSHIRILKEDNYYVALENLNKFHMKRWGKPCFTNESMDFHYRFLEKVKGFKRAVFSILEVDGIKISILYDVLVNNKIYNLQAGFDEAFDKKISVGTIHLGYEIESAFLRRDIFQYDLLAGAGKKTFYKSKFKGDKVDFKSSQYIRTWWLKCVVSIYKILPIALTRKLIQQMN